MPTLRILALLLAFPAMVHAEDWPGWLGPRRDGSTKEIVPAWKVPLKTLWKHPVGEGNSSPIVAAGKVYLFSKTGTKDQPQETLAAFDAVAGKPLWSKSYDRAPFQSLFGNGPRATPQVTGAKIFTFGITGVLTAFDADTGAIAWQVDTFKELGAKNLFFGASCSPLLVGGKLVLNIGGKGTSIVAFAADTGKVVWKTLDDPASYSSGNLASKDDLQQAIFLTGAHLVSVYPRDGSVFWQFPLVDKLSESSTTPVIAGDFVIASSVTYGSLCVKLDHTTNVPSAKKVWINSELNSYFSTPVAIGTQLYIVTATKPPALATSATLRCVDLKSGKELWNRPKVGIYHASLLRTGDDKLLLLEEKGDLVLLQPDPAAYKELARAKICGNTWSHAAVAAGRLYIRDNHELICVQLPK